MERRIGLAVAGAISLVVLAGTLALGANLGVFGGDEASVVNSGAIEPAAVTEEAQVVTVEVRDPSGRILGTSTSGSILPSTGSVAARTTSSGGDDSDWDDHSGPGGGGDDDDHDDDDHSGHGGGGDDDDDD